MWAVHTDFWHPTVCSANMIPIEFFRVQVTSIDIPVPIVSIGHPH